MQYPLYTPCIAANGAVPRADGAERKTDDTRMCVQTSSVFHGVQVNQIGTGGDKIVWSVRFRRARRTIVRRAAKSGAEKAKTLNFKQESVRIPTPYLLYGTY